MNECYNLQRTITLSPFHPQGPRLFRFHRFLILGLAWVTNSDNVLGTPFGKNAMTQALKEVGTLNHTSASHFGHVNRVVIDLVFTHVQFLFIFVMLFFSVLLFIL
jgi:hypothetical protein